VIRRRREGGQSLVEFALVLPIFMLGLFALIDGTRLIFLNNSLSQAAREGARQASVEAYWVGSSEVSCNTTGGPVCPADLNTFKTHVITAVNRMTVLGSISSGNVFISCDASTTPSGNWTGQTCSSRSAGGFVSVRVSSSFTPITPVIGQIFGAVSLDGSATMAIN
jgi:hypothetical protein